MKLIDLHNHTNFSYDGTNTCEEIIENAMSHSLSCVGISDHQFSIKSGLVKYVNEIEKLKSKYEKYIRVLCGLEIGLRPKPDDIANVSALPLDYCLFESLDSPKGAMDIYEFLEWTRLFKIPKGLAHTDIFMLEKKYSMDILDILSKNDLFWEINTSGNYTYYYDFITNKDKQNKISKSNIKISIGSDTHWVGDFNISKLKSAHELVCELKNTVIFT